MNNPNHVEIDRLLANQDAIDCDPGFRVIFPETAEQIGDAYWVSYLYVQQVGPNGVVWDKKLLRLSGWDYDAEFGPRVMFALSS